MIDASKELRGKYADIYIDKPIPNAFCESSLICNHDIQAIILGADPTNKRKLYFNTVFAMSPEDEELVRRRFKGWKMYKEVFYFENGDYRGYLGNIYENILALKLNKTNLYIQNLCRNYTTKVTSEFFNQWSSIRNIKDIELRREKIKFEMLNNIWVRLAREWTENLSNELNEFDPQCKVPVFITTEYLLLPLIKIDNIDEIRTPREYYDKNIIIEKDKNWLERNLVPFFRNDDYKLSDHIEYRDFIKNKILCKH